MKDKNMFELVGAVKKVYANDKGTFAVLTLETSSAGRRTNHEIKGFKETVKLIAGLQVGEVVKVEGSIGRMSSQDCDYAKIPPSRIVGESKYYPAIPTFNITSITKAQQSVVSDDNYGDEIPD